MCSDYCFPFPCTSQFLFTSHPFRYTLFLSLIKNTHRNLRSSIKIKYNYSLLIVLESLTHPLKPTVTRVYNLKWLRCLRQTDDKLQTCQADWAQGQSQHSEKLCLKIKRKRVSEGTAHWYSTCREMWEGGCSPLNISSFCKKMTVTQYNVQTQYLGGVKLLMSHEYED